MLLSYAYATPFLCYCRRIAARLVFRMHENAEGRLVSAGRVEAGYALVSFQPSSGAVLFFCGTLMGPHKLVTLTSTAHSLLPRVVTGQHHRKVEFDW